MITIIVSVVVSIATTAAVYWYLHRGNPDVAQSATDVLVDQIKKDVKDAVQKAEDAAKDVIK